MKDLLMAAQSNSGIRRRDFIRLTGLAGAAALAAACAPAATPSPESKAAPKQEMAPTAMAPTQAATAAQNAPSQASATAVWDKVVEDARKEGKVVVTTLAGDGYRKVLDKFQVAYPGVEVEHKSASSASFLAPPILQEQSGGVFSYDVCFLSPGGPIMGSMMPAGAFDDIRPALIHPDVTNDAAWIGGVDACFMDKARQKVFGVTLDENQTIMYNTDLVKTKPTTIKDLADPQWKGKLAFMEYQTGFTYIVAVGMNYHMKGEAAEWLKKIFVDQQPTFLREGRQATEGLIRGEYAFATGPTLPILEQFLAEGLGKNVAPLDVPEMKIVTGQGVLLYTKAPHPNAARLLINWLLGKEGGMAVIEHLRFNSRRADVPPANPDVHPGTDFEKIKREYLFGNVEEALPLQQQGAEQIKTLIGA
jgi:ABC-type Fe3+ transport system substrate-binding protein